MDGDVRHEARDVLAYVLECELPGHRWPEVERLVRPLADALAAGNRSAFEQAGSDLELISPVCAASADCPPREPAPEKVREGINELIHTLDGSHPIGDPDPGHGVAPG